MTTGAFTLPDEYWSSIQVTPQDVENLHTFLFERETPLTTRDLVSEFVEARIRFERQAAENKHKSAGKSYLPREQYAVGEDLVFPALEWKRGRVAEVRPGANPSVSGFDVLTVEMEDGGRRMFAARLDSHLLNDAQLSASEGSEIDLASILQEHGSHMMEKLEAALGADEGLVQIAGALVPRALLIDIM
jgi:hypothetical protein